MNYNSTYFIFTVHCVLIRHGQLGNIKSNRSSIAVSMPREYIYGHVAQERGRRDIDTQRERWSYKPYFIFPLK
jgi:hypothetical protein